MYFFDCHLHCKNNENGGFLIGLEGNPVYSNTYTNAEVLKLHCIQSTYIAFYYVSMDEIDKVIAHKYLKYHSRRERYSPEQVIKSIKQNSPKAIVIDSLNEPYWKAYDYWKIARSCSEIPVILAHAGGYLINDFIKICNFQKNVYIDFSLTHCVLGKYGADDGLRYINDAIHFALNSNFSDRVLMGSDYPFYCQEDMCKYYSDQVENLNTNFIKLFERIK